MARWGLMEARTIVGVQVAFNLNPAATTRTRLNYQPCLQRRLFSVACIASSPVAAISREGHSLTRRISLSDTRPQEFAFNPPSRCHN